MNVLFDSNTLVAFLVTGHVDHNSAYEAYIDYQSQNAELFIATHSVAEVYRTLTWGVEYLNYTAAQAHQIINHSILPVFKLIDLGKQDYRYVLDFLKEHKLTGPIIYDALIAYASEKAEAQHLVTFNTKDFKRIQQLTSAELIVL